MTSNDGLARRRAAMIAAGYWSDQTLLDHLNRAIERTPDKTALVAIRSESGEEKRLHTRRSASSPTPGSAASAARNWAR